MPEAKQQLEKLGADPTPMSQQQFASFVRQEMESTAALIKTANIRVE